MKVKMDEHLGYDRSNSKNACNGTCNKYLITENNVIELDIPRDRDGNFKLAIIPKRQTIIDNLSCHY